MIVRAVMHRDRRFAPFAALLLCVSFASFARERTTIYLAGDSTLAIKLDNKRPETGWGEALPQYFRDDAKIDNRAQNGRSTRTFIAERRWRAIVDALKPGDYVFIEFGHNDESKEKVDRYTPPPDYRANLTRFVAEVRARHATPILLTPVMRRHFDTQGNFVDRHGAYPGIVREVAQQQRVDLIDMHRLSERLLIDYGVEGSRKLFLQLAPGENGNYPNGIEDNTHFSPLGAEEMAKLAIASIRKQNLPLVRLLKPSTSLPAPQTKP